MTSRHVAPQERKTKKPPDENVAGETQRPREQAHPVAERESEGTIANQAASQTLLVPSRQAAAMRSARPSVGTLDNLLLLSPDAGVTVQRLV